MAKKTNQTVKDRLITDIATLRASQAVAYAGGFKIIGDAYERAIREFLTGAVQGDLNTVGVDTSSAIR